MSEIAHSFTGKKLTVLGIIGIVVGVAWVFLDRVLRRWMSVETAFTVSSIILVFVSFWVGFVLMAPQPRPRGLVWKRGLIAALCALVGAVTGAVVAALMT